MRTLAFVALLAVLVSPAALAQNVEVAMEAHDVYFTNVGEEAKNPTVTVAPGSTVSLSLVNVGQQPHNWQVDGIEGAKLECCLANGESNTIEFTAPSEPGTYEYYCLPHKAQGMKGSFVVADASTTTETDETDTTDEEEPAATNDSPGFGVLAALGAVAAVLVLRRRS